MPLVGSGIYIGIQLSYYLHDIHRLDEEGTNEGQYQGQVFESKSDSGDKSGRRKEKENPV